MSSLLRQRGVMFMEESDRVMLFATGAVAVVAIFLMLFQLPIELGIGDDALAGNAFSRGRYAAGNADLEIAVCGDGTCQDTESRRTCPRDCINVRGIREEAEEISEADSSADTDGDGLSDTDEETLHSTNPTNADTDGDCLEDGDEVNTYSTDPTDSTDSDLDNDALTACEELGARTDPTLSDTDGDCLSDYDELNTYRTNPTNSDDSDLDDDGLTACEEASYNLNNQNADTDGDGFTDGDEVTNGFGAGDSTDHEQLVYVATENGDIYASKFSSGVAVWDSSSPSFAWPGSVGPNFDFTSSVIVGSGSVFAGTDNGCVVALRAGDSEPQWSYCSSSYKVTGLAYSEQENAIIAQTVSSGEITAVVSIDADTGVRNWASGSSAGILDTLYATDPVIDSGIIFFQDGTYLTALDEATGNREWRIAAKNPRGSKMQIDSGKLFVPSGENIFAIQAATGATLWAHTSDYHGNSESTCQIAGPLVVDGSTLYAVMTMETRTSYVSTQCSDELIALSTISGQEQWGVDLESFDTSAAAAFNPSVEMFHYNNRIVVGLRNVIGTDLDEWLSISTSTQTLTDRQDYETVSVGGIVTDASGAAVAATTTGGLVKLQVSAIGNLGLAWEKEVSGLNENSAGLPALYLD